MILIIAKWFIEICKSTEELESFLSMGYFENEIIFIFDLKRLRIMRAYNYFRRVNGRQEMS